MIRDDEEIKLDFEPVEEFTVSRQARVSTVNLAGMDEHELLTLRAEIDQRLVVKKLEDMDMERELVLQLRMSQALQTNIIDDDRVPANQKAQVMNSVASTIQQITKMQGEIYTSERLKRIESALIKQLNQWPEDQTRTFFERYTEILNS